MEMVLRVVDIVLLDDKYRSYINCSSKYECVTVFYLVGTYEKKEIWNLMVSYFMKN